MSTVLVDANNLLMRAVFAMRTSSLQADGWITGPTHGFITSLSRLVRENRPDRLLVCWDTVVPSWRAKLSPAYKAHRIKPGEDDARRRQDSFLLTQAFLALAGIGQLQRDGQEADDLIAGAWVRLTPLDADDAIIIISSDKDLTQMLGSNPAGMPTEQIRLSSHEVDTDRWTAQTLLDHEGWEPWQVPLVMALMGDQADGVAGVPGIGKKRASTLLEAHDWDFKKVVAHLGEKYGAEVAAQAWVDLGLVSLRHSEQRVHVPSFTPTAPGDQDWGALTGFLDRYELAQTKAHLIKGSLWRPREEVRMPGRHIGCPPSG